MGDEARAAELRERCAGLFDRFGIKSLNMDDLAKHMAECDMNYHKLYKLFKDMRSRKTKTISLDFGDHAVKVRIAVTDR